METVTIVAARETLSPDFGMALVAIAVIAGATALVLARLREHRSRTHATHGA